MDLPDPLLAPPPPWVPPFSAYLRRDESIRVTSYNALASVGLTIRSRLLRPTGGISDGIDTQTPNTDRSAKTTIVRQDEGWLLDGQVVVTTAAPLVGQCFVVVEIVRGDGAVAVATRVLAAGYVTAKQPLLFPQPTIASSLDGAGAIRAIAGTTPGAGAEISEVVPAGARWELLALSFTFATSAAVANRVPQVVLKDATPTIIVTANSGAVIAANGGASFSYFSPGPAVVTASPTQPMQTLPRNILGAGFRWGTSTTAIQAADQYTAVEYLVREWIEGA